MKAFLLGVFLANVIAISAHASPVGLWKSEVNKDGRWIEIDIFTCGQEVCGKVAKIYNGPQDDLSKVMIKGMVHQGDGKFSGGKIYAPDTRKWYTSKMQLKGNRLKVSGCVMGGLVCRSQNWIRLR